MKDSMEFDDEDQRESESNWQIGAPSTPSFEALGSRSVLQSHNLQILFKKEKPSERRIIPATLHEKLSFYRAFVSSPSKTQLVSMHQVLFNKYLWLYIFNLFCKSLPSTYVYVFLSSYAAEDHFFVSKMIPLCYGHMWYSIISAFIANINSCGYIALLWDYVISGLLYKNPWNRCGPYYNLTKGPECYEVKDFTKKIANQTLLFDNYGYVVHSNVTTEAAEYFQMAPLLFLKSRLMRYSITPSHFWMFETVIFLIACLSYKQLFQKYVWKFLHCNQILLFVMYLITFCHLVTFYFINGFKKVPEPIDAFTDELWNADVDMLAESMTSPPIIHILSARSTEKPKPSRDSTRIIASNAFYYMFRGLLAYMMKRYCEHIIGTTLLFMEFNPCSSFFFWPIYLSYFYLGDYYTLLYFVLNGIEEFLVMAITLHCLIEAVVCEWSWMKAWRFVILISLMAIIMTSVVTVNYRSVLYVYMTCFSTLSETIVIFWMYPLGRLIDDITFHTGAPPTTLRIWNLRIVPIFYTTKLIILLNGFLDIIRVIGIDYKLMYAGYYLLYIQAVPFILGSFYAIYVIVCREKQGWKQLFVPVPEWGPKDPKVRRLRNQYDSRQYIDSQAPRELSRYLIEKAELKTYRVDIQYESRFKTQRDLRSEVRFEDEKKNE